MITSAEIRSTTFTRAARGYKTTEVDEVLDRVIETIDQLNRENAEILRKLEVLADKIQDYRNDEDSIRSALLTAQRSADQIMREATENKERTESEANARAEELIFNSKKQAEETLKEAQEKAVAIVNETREKATMVMAEAKEKAGKTMADAQDRASQMLNDATEGCKNERMQLEHLKRQTNEFRAALMQMYRDQFELLKRGPVVSNATIDDSESEFRTASITSNFGSRYTAPVREEKPVEPAAPKYAAPEVPEIYRAPETPAEPEETEDRQKNFVAPEDIPLPVAKGPADYEDEDEEPAPTEKSSKYSSILGGFKLADTDDEE